MPPPAPDVLAPPSGTARDRPPSGSPTAASRILPGVRGPPRNVVARGTSWATKTVRPSAVSCVWMYSRTGTRLPSRCSAGSGTERPTMRVCPVSSIEENPAVCRPRRCSGISVVRRRPTRSSGSQPSRSAAAPLAATIRLPSSAATVGILLARTWPTSHGTSSAELTSGSRGTTVHAVGRAPVSCPVISSKSQSWKARPRGRAGSVSSSSSRARASARSSTRRSARTAGRASADSGTSRVRRPDSGTGSSGMAVTPALITLLTSVAATRSWDGTPRRSPAKAARVSSRSTACRC